MKFYPSELQSRCSVYNEVSRKLKQNQITQIQSYLKSEVSAYKEVPRRLKHMRTEFLVGFRVWSQGWEEHAREISSLRAPIEVFRVQRGLLQTQKKSNNTDSNVFEVQDLRV